MPDPSQFAIGFDERDRARLHELWDGVIDSQRWSEGDLTARFEETWGAGNGVGGTTPLSINCLSLIWQLKIVAQVNTIMIAVASRE